MHDRQPRTSVAVHAALNGEILHVLAERPIDFGHEFY